jgi:tetratricopeptide (TPR) repeat protein
MGLFGPKAYKRSDSLEAASKAQARGNKKKAIREYRKVLDHEPDNHMVLTKLAALLAQTNQSAEARAMFVHAGEGFSSRGFDDKAIATYAVAAMHLPREVELIGRLAQMLVEKGRTPDALKTLIEGSRRLHKRTDRALAIALLERACAIEPWHFESTFELARLFAKDRRFEEAKALLETLASRNVKRNLRRARGALFRISPTPAAAWRWLRAAIAGR